MLLGVEEEHLVAALVVGGLAGQQAGRVVGGRLDGADAADAGADVVGLDVDLHRLEAGREVGPHRPDDDEEEVGGGDAHADSRGSVAMIVGRT